MPGTSEGAAKRRRCHCGAFAHNGDCPERGVPAQDVFERIVAGLDIRGDDECMEWMGERNKQGYGVIKLPGQRKAFVHRIVAGALPGEVVRHRCDNPPCANIRHLTRGTHQENSNDMVQRGRSAAGEKHPRAKLTQAKVDAIRADIRATSVLAKEYGVDPSTIRKLRRNALWVKPPQ